MVFFELFPGLAFTDPREGGPGLLKPDEKPAWRQGGRADGKPRGVVG